MSNRLLTLAKTLPLRGGQKTLLVMLADAAGDDGACWQSVATLAQWAGVGSSTAWRHLAALVDLGVVSRRRRRNTSSMLHVDEAAMRALVGGESGGVVIALPAPSEPTENSQIENSQSENSRISNPELSIRQVAYKDEPKHNPHSSSSTPPSTHRKDPSAPFDRFWAAYPRRVGKQAAIKAWTKATKTADPEHITAAATAYAAYCRKVGRDTEHIAHPSSWLNAGRWDDELGATASTSDPAEWLRGEWQAGRVTEIHKHYASDYAQPPATGGDYWTDVLKPYNRQWITDHHDKIIARLRREVS